MKEMLTLRYTFTKNTYIVILVGAEATALTLIDLRW